MAVIRPVDIRMFVTEMLGRTKRIAGRGEWTDDHRRGESRLVLQLEEAGEVSDLELQIKVQRNSKEPEFVLMMIYELCVWRVCYGLDVEHVNRVYHPSSLLPAGLIEGPHYHAWADNQHLGTARALPKRLMFGNKLPTAIDGFALAFRWFCAETNVEIDDGDVPALPPRDLLI